MNKLLIPPSPNWYETDIMACAPDNTLIYGSRQDIVVIKTTPEYEPDDVQVVTRAHSMKIKSVNINRNWGRPHKYVVTASEDKIVKLWDIESLEKRLSHNKHVLQDDDSKVVGASFAGDDRVISTSESGTVVIWNIIKNETNILSPLFDAKMTVTCLSVCPHATWLTAFGLKNGLIAVADLRRTGKVLYKIRGHSKAVVSLSWCPAPVNIFPVKPTNKVVEKVLEENSESVKIDEEKGTETVECNTQTQKELENDCEAILGSTKEVLGNDTKKEMEESLIKSPELTKEDKGDRRKQKKPKKAPNPWVDLVHADDDDNSNSTVKKLSTQDDFLKQCADLRQHILQVKDENKVVVMSATQESSVHKRVILKPKGKSQKSKLSDLLLNREQALKSESTDNPDTLSEETFEKKDTPTDRRQINMEISYSVEKLKGKLTDVTGGMEEFTNNVDSAGSDIDKKELAASGKGSLFDCSKLDSTTSSDEGKQFSSVSSCSNDCTCSKSHKAKLEEDVKKSDTSGSSESENVFHDAEVCEVQQDKERETCKVEEPVSFDEQPRKEFLLASSARELNIYIWRAGTDGRMQCFMTVPPVKNQKKPHSEKMWITVCWVAPNILLSSSRGAELLQWTLPKPIVQSKFVRQVHKDHWSVLFSIKAPILYLNEYNFLQKRDINAWTTGMDRTILNTDIGSQKNLACYQALGGSVNCFAGSPLDPNRLAFGTGEGILNVWDLSREHKKRIVFSTFYQKIVASITALAWHPRVETSVALATIEGTIGILDVVAKTKSPKILSNGYFKSQVFKMEWGPFKGDLQNPRLFVVAEAKVTIFDPKSKGEDPLLLELPDNTSVYTMSWKPDYSILLVSSKSGSLITYTPDLKISTISYLRQKLQSIVWNPNAASDDTSVSKYCRAFASVIKHTECVVYDLGMESDDKVIARFENRGVIINSIEWNPHTGHQLVLVDDGGIAQVYDIETKTVLSTYVNPWLDSMLSAYWSPVDKDFVITGTVGHKIIVWKVSENAALTDKEINSIKNRITKAQTKEVGDQLAKLKVTGSQCEDSDATKVKKSTKSNVLPTFYGIKEKSAAQDIRKLLQWKLGDQTVESNIGDTKYVVDVLEVFDDKNNMEKVLNCNISAFRQRGQHHNADLLSLFKGDLSTAVKDAIDQKRVSPWVISMCPMVSPKLWQAACETYADQLRDEPDADPMEIVTYLLACHKVEESVNVLCERAMFKEALVLAKARFGAENTVVSMVMEKWAKSSMNNGNLELAAQCYISLGRFQDAAAVLFRRSNVDILELAVELAKLSGNEELHKAVMFRFNAFTASKMVDKTNKDESIKTEINEHDHRSTKGCHITEETNKDKSNNSEVFKNDLSTTELLNEKETKVVYLKDETNKDESIKTEINEHDHRSTKGCHITEETNKDKSNNSEVFKNDLSTKELLNEKETKVVYLKDETNKDERTNSKIIKQCDPAAKEILDEKETKSVNIKDVLKECKEPGQNNIVELNCHTKEHGEDVLERICENSNKELGDKVVVGDTELAEVEFIKGKLLEKAKELDEYAIKEDSNKNHGEPKDTENRELLSESLMEKADTLGNGAKKLLESQESLLAAVAVQLERKMDSDKVACVEEKKEE